MVFSVDLLGRGLSTNSTSVSGSFQRESFDTSSSQKLLQTAALPSSVFIVLHNGWPLVVNRSISGRCVQTVSLMRLHYLAVASFLTEHNLVYLGTAKSPCDSETPSTSVEQHETSSQSSIAHFCVDLSKLSTDEVVRLGSNSLHTELIHPFRFLQLSSEDRMLYSRASPILDWHSKNQFCPACGSGTSMAHGGYKRVCQSVDCLTHRGRVFLSSIQCC